jgi:type III secretion protein J
LTRLFLPLFIALAGCTVPIAAGLDETQANRVVVALDRAGVGAEKESDPGAEGRLRVSVEREDAPRAIAALREEELPAPNTPGLLEALGKGGLVPSQLTEHAQFMSGLSGEIERTLGTIDGVLVARVHLSLAERDPLREGARPKSTASVLLKHRGSSPPIDPLEIRRLVAGAAPGLLPDDVAVVMVPRPAPAAAGDRALARLGPIATTRGSLKILRTAAAAVLVIDVALVMTVLMLWSRLRKLRAGLHEGPATLGTGHDSAPVARTTSA